MKFWIPLKSKNCAFYLRKWQFWHSQYPIFCYCFVSKWQNFVRQWISDCVTSGELQFSKKNIEKRLLLIPVFKKEWICFATFLWHWLIWSYRLIFKSNIQWLDFLFPFRNVKNQHNFLPSPSIPLTITKIYCAKITSVHSQGLS